MVKTLLPLEEAWVRFRPQKIIKQYSYHLVNYKDFRNPVSGTRVKDQILEPKCSWCSYHFEELQGLKGSVLGTRGRHQCVLSHISIPKGEIQREENVLGPEQVQNLVK